MRPRPLAVAVLIAVGVALAGLPSSAQAKAAAARPAAASPSAAPAVLKLKRPVGGEWFGLYLMGKKAGYAFADLREGEYAGHKVVVAENTITLKVSVGGVQATREMREERTYEYRDGGRLLAFKVEKRGDGGEETLLGTCEADGIKLVRQRPGLADETRRLPPTADVVEYADAPRLVAATGEEFKGATLDLEDTLTDKRIVVEYVGKTSYPVAGLKVPAVSTRLLEEKLKVPTMTTIADDGRTLEIRLGEVVGKAEDEATAKQLDKVDLFSLTRVVLDKSIPRAAREAPGAVRFVVQGLPAQLRYDTYRQRYEPRADGAAVLTIRAQLPKARVKRPVAAAGHKGDTEIAEALEATLAVESEAPAIVALAKQVVGDERDAWAAARKINAYVNRFLEKAYGASSDRATDVLTAKKGDCTEHSLLATALARAAGIPARRVDGLVYMEAGDGVPALYWHEWVEVWVGEWVAMDPTFNQNVADATHIALGREGRSDTAGLIGQVKVTVATP